MSRLLGRERSSRRPRRDRARSPTFQPTSPRVTGRHSAGRASPTTSPSATEKSRGRARHDAQGFRQPAARRRWGASDQDFREAVNSAASARTRRACRRSRRLRAPGWPLAPRASRLVARFRRGRGRRPASPCCGRRPCRRACPEPVRRLRRRECRRRPGRPRRAPRHSG